MPTTPRDMDSLLDVVEAASHKKAGARRRSSQHRPDASHLVDVPSRPSVSVLMFTGTADVARALMLFVTCVLPCGAFD